jgi:hypothetical protein
MSTQRKPKSAQLLPRLNTLARDYVNSWIERGLSPEEMREKVPDILRVFRAGIQNDIGLYASTGKYPRYDEQDLKQERT